ncbi:ubiquinone biosynthesis O-methyltransferase, mitochondrial [Chrysoperla carnea]|uniref:ubiquinone biosynthesis O-methyltransferase, mitochondrial n=1 Tax=Chrysoperla carnea TaxID=189513 RepID=UPI001D089026|nr:ubiquinone biosynthesis O-methyltransferase, mitochondrial [Chrysoperla carnea]XP_044738625.1 ubiquinone biosynthesis O-methyltransferase, mitochondrial [Chrysoperla carnea]
MIISRRLNFCRYKICRHIYSTYKEFSTKPNPKGTTDENELQYFSKMADDWWNTKGPMQPLHDMNELRVPFIRDSLIDIGKTKKENSRTDHPLEGVNILEVGCGGGILTEALARIGATMTGIDVASDLIKMASTHANQDSKIKDRIKYTTESIEVFSEKNPSSFDAVVCSEVIEHVTEKDLFVKSAVQALKPGGSIFITTIEKSLSAWVTAIVFAEYLLNIIPRGTHEYDKLISPHEMQRILETNNCSTRLIQGWFYNPVTRKWAWSRATMFYALHAIKDA